MSCYRPATAKDMVPEGMKPKIVVYFRLKSPHHTLAQLTQLVGLPPDKGWSVGDPWPIFPERKLQFSNWSIKSRCTAPAYVDDAARRLIKRLAPVVPRITALDARIRRELWIEVTTHRTVFSKNFSKKTIQFLAHTGAHVEESWVVDTYTEEDLQRLGVVLPVAYAPTC